MARKFRIGFIGGGCDSFSGEFHRKAIAQSGIGDIVCGAFGATRNSSFVTGKAMGLPVSRVYGTYRDLFRCESKLAEDERADFVVVLTPSGMHYPICTAAIDAKIPVFCEKPFANNVDEAVMLYKKLMATQLPYGLASVYAGYPALQTMRQRMIEGQLGNIRKVIVSAFLGWMTQRIENNGNRQAAWRTDPRRAGATGCLQDLGVHCYLLTAWLTGLGIKELCAELEHVVPGRVLDDDCAVQIRFNNGAVGSFLCSQVACGEQEGLSFKVYGDKASFHWRQAEPHLFRVLSVDGHEEIVSVGAACADEAPLSCAAPFRVDAAYIQALASAYQSFAAYLRDPAAARAAPGGLGFATPEEGLHSVVFTHAGVRNATPLDPNLPMLKWTPFVVPDIQPRLN